MPLTNVAITVSPQLYMGECKYRATQERFAVCIGRGPAGAESGAKFTMSTFLRFVNLMSTADWQAHIAVFLGVPYHEAGKKN